MTTDALYRRPGWQLAAAVTRGELTAAAIADAFIERINELNPLYKAFVHLDEDYWRRQADHVDRGSRRGALAGVPVGVKDVFNTEVYPTEMGSPIWKGHTAGNDARCVSYVRWEGGIIAGKTDTAEFAVHAPNQVKNPWNTAHVAGTSSGGSAVAVASGMVPMALGTQTAGSTIRPASWCGVYAMKPSFGLIPRTGVLKTTDTLDNIGFYGRDVTDLRLLLDVLRVHGDNYPGREQRLLEHGQVPARPWRVGFIRGHLWNEAASYVQTAMEALAREIDALENVEVVDVDLPSMARGAHELHRRVYNPCLAYYFREEIRKAPELITECFMRLVRDGQTIPPDDYKRALAEQEQLAQQMHDLFVADIDVLIHHSSTGSAPLGLEPEINKDLNLLWTLSWLPVVNIPRFQCSKGLPFGFQVIGRRYSDYRLFHFIEMLVEKGVAPATALLAEQVAASQ